MLAGACDARLTLQAPHAAPEAAKAVLTWDFLGLAPADTFPMTHLVEGIPGAPGVFVGRTPTGVQVAPGDVRKLMADKKVQSAGAEFSA
jgi:hypothetical protein